MRSYLLGFDIGTLSSKSVLTDLEGNIVGTYQKEHKIEVKHPGWQEESMQMWWEEFREAVQTFLNLDGVTKEEIKAIGITGLIPALCAVDRQINPIRNAILHTDVRAEKELEEINEMLPSGISHGHMLPKLLWVKNQEKPQYDTIYKAMVPHGYLACKLTGEATMDYDSATMVGGLFDSERFVWDEEQIERFGLNKEIFPTPQSANGVIGTITKEAAKETGLWEGTKVIAGVGDTFASMLGGGAYSANHFMIYLGTSATSIYAEGSPKEYMNVPHYGDGKGHFAGRIFSFGESILHLRNNLGYDSWGELNSHLDEITPGSDGLWYFPHYKLQTEASFFGPDAEFMLGYRGCHTKYHWYHGMLEGIAYNAKYNVANFKLPIEQINIFGGGANSKEICQIFADVLGRELYHNPKSSTAFGIAFLAGYATGEIAEYETLKDVWFGDSVVITPDANRSKQYEELYKTYQQLRSRLMEVDTAFAERKE